MKDNVYQDEGVEECTLSSWAVEQIGYDELDNECYI